MTLILFVFFQNAVHADPFAPGEKVHYNILQMGIKVGEATLTFVGTETHQNRSTVLVVFHAQGINFFDQENIYLKPQDFKPLFVERHLNIFGNKETIVEEYTQGHVKIIKTSDGKTIQQMIDKDGWMDNIYAFIYRYRRWGKLQMNEHIDLHLPTKDIKIGLIKQDWLWVAGKNYNIFYMESDPAKFRIWFDSSNKKLPLRISGAIGLANTVMTMTGYEN